MAIKQYLKRALSLPPHVVALKIYEIIIFRILSSVVQMRDKLFSTYSKQNVSIQIKSLFPAPPRPEQVKAQFSELEFLLAKTMAHEFDLLGSGWKKLKLDQAQAPVVNSSNQQYSQRILSLLSTGYERFDWHTDFKSGYRWNPQTWCFRVPYGHQPGVDIKVPWELARGQHLVWLVLGFGVAKSEQKESLADSYALEFQNQILDFIASNPPRYGVNWRCAMDVAIRAANWVLAFDWLCSYGWQPNREFQTILTNSLHDHGQFVFGHLEFGKDGFRGNHYLADICGLAFVAAALSDLAEAKKWLSFSRQALLTEMDYQFFADGSNFEGSTAYHRLSAEMMLYTALLFQVLEQKNSWSESFAGRLLNMAEFSQSVTRPDGFICQIGDNDDGRFFKIQSEHPLCHQSLIESIRALNGQSGSWKSLEAAWISDLVKNHTVPGLAAHPQPAKARFENTELVKNYFDEGLFSQQIYDFLTQVTSFKKVVIPESLTALKTRLDVADTGRLQTCVWSEFGLVTWKNEQFFMSFRCGPIGQKSRGGHDHNDQLSVEIFSNGQALLEDPGTGIYTAYPEIRNRYRSAAAHHGPHVLNEDGNLIEPGSLDQGLFSLNSNQFSDLFFANESCAVGYNDKLKTIRVIWIEINSIEIQDICLQPAWRLAPVSKADKLKTSRGYGCF